MPNNGQDCLDIAEYLGTLEDNTLYSKKSRMRCFISLQTIFEENGAVTPPDVKRILTVFMNCMKEDINCLPHAISAITSLMTNVKIIPSLPVQDLLPSALALLHMIKTLCASTGTEILTEMSFELFLSYPMDVLNAMVLYNCSEILQIINGDSENDLRRRKVTKERCVFLHKLLKMLPPEQKLQFVNEGLDIWFRDFIPTAMAVLSENSAEHLHLLYLDCLETLTDTLVELEYSQSPLWQLETLRCICNPQMYPLIMKTLLQSGSIIWHRVWIVFVKIIKKQITSNIGSHGTPINAMLPVVELAFKMDVPTRCRAFECWDSLIENFSKETNLLCLPKRIKLLLIPLKLHNAKTEETALAKFNTWWNLIRKIDHRLETFIEVLVCFIYFAFGKEATEKPAIVGAGQLYDSVRELSLQAFAQLIGHLDCHYCTALPTLERKILINKLLASNWGDIMFALKTSVLMRFRSVFKECGVAATEINLAPVSCVWKSMFIAIAELPPNGVRWDLFNGLFQVLIDMTESCHSLDNLSVILFTLTLSLIKDEVKIQDALTAITKGEKPLLHKMIPIVINPVMSDVWKGCDPEKVVEMLKPLTNLIVETRSSRWLLTKLPLVDSSVRMWVALLHSVNEIEIVLCPELMRKLLEWPLKSINDINMDNHASIEWCKAYNLNFEIVNKHGLEKEIMKCITSNDDKQYKRYFVLCITICLLKGKLIDGRGEDAGCLPNILQNLSLQMHDYNEFEPVVPMLVDTIVVMMNNVTINENEQIAGLALNCAINILKMFIAENKSEVEAVTPLNENISMMLTTLFNAVDLLFKFPLYSAANCDFVNKLTEQALLSKESSIVKFIVSKMKTLNGSVETVKNRIYDSIDMIEGIKNKGEGDTSGDTIKNFKQFASPDIKKVVKKSKKTEASIVNTVVENGEEYVVVKSTWKFNPRKLTENQKEKFQKKREDIPALYQDLSQSQDEFKLTSWKTNSQDATCSNSKSEDSLTNNALSILENITNSDVVPNIIEKILSENDKNHTSVLKINNVKDIDLPTDKPNKPERLSLSIPKNTKSPRMALKDRVFRNVRNLIEKSTPKNKIEEIQVTSQGLTEIIPKTPQTKPKQDSNLINSAPPLLSADRPSRVKRTPKKFDDVKLFAIKKARRSPTDCNSDSHNESEMIISHENNKHHTDSDISSDKTIVQINNNNTGSEIVKQKDGMEIEENVETIPNVLESEVTEVPQQHATKDALDEPITDDICESQSNDKAHDVQNNLDAQDDHTSSDTNEASKKVDNNVTVEKRCDIENKQNETIILSTPVKVLKEITPKSSTKKSVKKKSRIEKELAIDMVEGHPFLKVQSEKRLTRRKVMETENTNKTKSRTSNKIETKTSPKVDKKSKEKGKLIANTLGSHTTVKETQERLSSSDDGYVNDDAPCSEDVIESSQDSTLTTISVKSTKRTPKRLPIVTVARLENISKFVNTETQDLLQDSCCEILSVTNKSVNQESKDDIELPQNKTAEVEKNQSELTENMDTELAGNESISDDVLIVNDDELPNIACIEKSVGPETQELAEADTQPNDPTDFVEFEQTKSSPKKLEILNAAMDIAENIPPTKNVIEINSEPNESLITSIDKCTGVDTDVSSPFKDDTQRKQDFLNNTSEISPIKVQSPDRAKTCSPKQSEETSSDYMVVKLSTPVQSNGEPFDKSDSPELFTEDKTSPDKRDQSPPRAEVTTSGGSPSSSLSLKKNRPQTLRPGGRAAHMLGLCVPNSLNAIKNSERFEPDDIKKGNTSTPAKRNLRVIYNTVGDNGDKVDENEEQVNFLKFKKALPSTDCSPSVPILKRKLIDIVDDATLSPANKRKRVSFHDPPVSTTVSVQKYIESGCVKSPSSASKRVERPTLRQYSKPPKRLETTFVKLDTVLSKAVESFSEEQANSLTNDTNASLDVTPAVAVVNTSELNDTDPICPDLVDCKDPIENIAMELSSPAMKELFIKELEGKVGTVGDLATMTELEVNRLCIKAPKVQIAKKVLTDYVNKRVGSVEIDTPEAINVADDTALATEMSEEMSELESKTACVETQTDEVAVCDMEMQTSTEIVKMVSTQTNDLFSMAHTSTQTVETGSKSTSEIISSCLSEREDFVDRLSEQLEETSMRKISEQLPTDAIIDVLAKKCDDSTLKLSLTSILDRQSKAVPDNEKKSKELSVLNDILIDRFGSKELILFCSQLLKKVYDIDTP